MMTAMTERMWTGTELRAELAKYHQELLAAGNHRPSTIATYVQHPERFIAYLEGSYDPRQPQGRNAR
jgi:isopenicillin N synthase-like dioxygenase